MSNHVHVVLHVDVTKAQGWSDKQVLALWHSLYKGIAYSLKDYCELVDTTGKIVRDDKRGYIDDKHPILERLGLDSVQWLILTTEFEEHFNTAVGSEHLMRQFGIHTEHQKIWGIGKAKRLLKYSC